MLNSIIIILLIIILAPAILVASFILLSMFICTIIGAIMTIFLFIIEISTKISESIKGIKKNMKIKATRIKNGIKEKKKNEKEI